MKRIDTATRQVDKFGSGKDGFTDGVPGSTAPTSGDSTWHDHQQEEIARFIEARGGALNPSVYTQLRDAIVGRALCNWHDINPAQRAHKVQHVVVDMSVAGSSRIMLPDFGDVERIDAMVEGDLAAGDATLNFLNNSVGAGLSLGTITFLATDTGGTVRSLVPTVNNYSYKPQGFVGCDLATTNTTACRCNLIVHLRSHFDFTAWQSVAYDDNGDWLVAVGFGGSVPWIGRGRAAGQDWERVAAAGAYVGSFYDVAFGNSRFVTVGSYGEIQVSDDNGATWTKYGPGSGYAGMFFAVAYNGSTMWLACGDAGQIQSADVTAGTWTSRRSGVESLKAITYSSSLGLWVVVGSAGTILTSPDGITWTSRTSGTSNNLSSVVWDGTQFVAAGGIASADVCVSTDGITWTKTSPATLGRPFTSLAAFAGWLVGVNGTWVMISGDGGTTWSEREGVIPKGANKIKATVSNFMLVASNYGLYKSHDVH